MSSTLSSEHDTQPVSPGSDLTQDLSGLVQQSEMQQTMQQMQSMMQQMMQQTHAMMQGQVAVIERIERRLDTHEQQITQMGAQPPPAVEKEEIDPYVEKSHTVRLLHYWLFHAFNA